MEFYKHQKDVMLSAANKWLTGSILIKYEPCNSCSLSFGSYITFLFCASCSLVTWILK